VAWSLLLDPSCTGGGTGNTDSGSSVSSGGSGSSVSSGGSGISSGGSGVSSGVSGISSGGSSGGNKLDGSIIPSLTDNTSSSSILGDSISGYTYDLIAVGRQVLSDRFRQGKQFLSSSFCKKFL
jgi:hypothetical protein